MIEVMQVVRPAVLKAGMTVDRLPGPRSGDEVTENQADGWCVDGP
jgi:hypothetical protein